MNRSIQTLALALFASALAAAFAAPIPAVVKIGAVETLTGDNATYGISIRKGIELAASELNASKFLGAAQISLVVMDDKADKQEGISVFTKLINEDKVAAIIGPTLSSTAFAADPIAQKAGVPILGTSTTAIGITAMGDYIFRDSLPQGPSSPAPSPRSWPSTRRRKPPSSSNPPTNIPRAKPTSSRPPSPGSTSSSSRARATARATRTSEPSFRS